MTNACFTPGIALISSRLALTTLPREHRALLEHGVQHARHLDVDAEDRLARHDGRVVDALRVLADDLEVLRVLERDRLESGRRNGRGLGRAARCTRRGGANARASPHRTPSCTPPRARSTSAPPRRRASRGQRRRRGASAASCSAWRCCRQRSAAVNFVVSRSPCSMRTLFQSTSSSSAISIGQHRLHALPDLRVLGDDRDEAVRRQLDVRVRREVARLRRGGQRLEPA